MTSYHTPVSVPDMVKNGIFMQIAAPMVRYSKYEARTSPFLSPIGHSLTNLRFVAFLPLFRLPFRLLCKKYGCNLTYTPMITSEEFVASQEARLNEFSTNSGTSAF